MKKPLSFYLFYLLHVLALSAFFIPFKWEYVLVMFVSAYIRDFGVGMGYHRYFSHRSFKTGRIFEFIMALLGHASLQGKLYWWVYVHHYHHANTDKENDIHSPNQGFWFSHMGWFWSDLSYQLESKYLTTDLNRNQWLTKNKPHLDFLEKFWLVPGLAWAGLLFWIGGLPYLVWGFILSTLWIWHITYMINSVAHTFGTQPNGEKDRSRNGFILAIITLGEGWHNNHHAVPGSAKLGWEWWQIDITWGVLKMLEKLGIVWDLKLPPERIKNKQTD